MHWILSINILIERILFIRLLLIITLASKIINLHIVMNILLDNISYSDR